jgi:hypothetical protein
LKNSLTVIGFGLAIGRLLMPVNIGSLGTYVKGIIAA